MREMLCLCASNSRYEVKIGPVWSMNAGIEANILRKPRKELAQSAVVYQNENCCLCTVGGKCHYDEQKLCKILTKIGLSDMLSS
jgi:hypothetical protein